jgi:hypothetical protein
MEIIDELEPIKRGLYGGACGYLSFSGEMDLAIAIRTGIVKNGMLYVQAAAGIVADSIPESEWQETENKARALLRAAEQVQAGRRSAFIMNSKGRLAASTWVSFLHRRRRCAADRFPDTPSGCLWRIWRSTRSCSVSLEWAPAPMPR